MRGDLWPLPVLDANTCTSFALSGRTPETAAEPYTFEQQLLGLHRQQDTLLASWSQQQNTVKAQQNQLL